MKEIIRKLNPEQEFYISEGCFIIELSNSPDDPEVSVARARVAPGVTTQWHLLKSTTERYVILNGQGQVEIGDLPSTSVLPGDTVTIPQMCKQRITNTGNDDLIFLAICSPRFIPKNYQRLS